MRYIRFFSEYLFLSLQLGVFAGLLWLGGAYWFSYTDTISYRIVGVFLLIILLSNLSAKTIARVIRHYAAIF